MYQTTPHFCAQPTVYRNRWSIAR